MRILFQGDHSIGSSPASIQLGRCSWCGLWLLVAVSWLIGCSEQPQAEFAETIECRSPNGRRATKIIKRWKYDSVRETILRVLPTGDEEMSFATLKEKVTAEYPEEERLLFGTLGFYIDTVTLELETSGELVRFPNSGSPLPPNVRRTR